MGEEEEGPDRRRARHLRLGAEADRDAWLAALPDDEAAAQVRAAVAAWSGLRVRVAVEGDLDEGRESMRRLRRELDESIGRVSALFDERDRRVRDELRAAVDSVARAGRQDAAAIVSAAANAAGAAVAAAAARAGPAPDPRHERFGELLAHLARVVDSLNLTAASSSARGRAGEEAVENLLRERLVGDGWTVENVASEPGSCDIRARRPPNRVIAVEVKNYSATVPHHEYAKFAADVARLPPDAVGILVSLGRPVARRPAFALEVDAEGRALLVVPDASLELAWTAFRVACCIQDERARLGALLAAREDRDRAFEAFRSRCAAFAACVRALIADATEIARGAEEMERRAAEMRERAEAMRSRVYEATRDVFAASGVPMEGDAAVAEPSPPSRSAGGAVAKRRRAPGAR